MAEIQGDEKQAVFNVVFAYADFWKATAGRRGWEVPLFTFEDVRPLLERAATIVVRIRRTLDAAAGETPQRKIDGAAHEYLFSLKKSPRNHSDRFVRNLVHATLHNASGYVEGLTAARVDEMIAKFDPVLHTGQADQKTKEKLRHLLTQLSRAWGKACAAIGPIIGEDAEAFVARHNRWDIPKLERLISDAGNLIHNATGGIQSSHTAAAAHKRRRKHRKAAGGTQPGGAAAAAGNTGRVSAEERVATPSTQQDQAYDENSVEPLSDEDFPLFTSHGGPQQAAATIPVTVQRVEFDISAIERELAALSEALDEDESTRGKKPVPGGVIQALLLRCKEFLDTLAEDMAVVKGLHMDPTQERTEVSHIETAATEVLEVSHRIASLSAKLDAEADDMSTRSSAGDEGDTAPMSVEAATRDPATRTMLDKVRSWFRALRLEPRVDIRETTIGYSLQMYLPNLKEEDLSIMVNQNGDLVIKGFRGPTDEVLVDMLHAIDPETVSRESFLQLGVGEYGSFMELFRVPKDVTPEAISGHYEAGLLSVALPKRSEGARAQMPEGLLRHPADAAPRRRMFMGEPPSYSSFAAGAAGPETGPNRAAAAWEHASPVTADPRTLGAFKATRAPAGPTDTEADTEEPTGGPHEGTEAGPFVTFVDAQTGAKFRVPLAALPQLLGAAPPQQAQPGHGTQGHGPGRTFRQRAMW